MNIIIVDDEHRSIDNLRQLLSEFCPDVHILSEENEILSAYKSIQKYEPDIVFLDVDMPPHTGFDLLKMFDELPFEVIFVTAYDYYAIDAIKFSALYYILKPIKIEELIGAINKARKNLTRKRNQSTEFFKRLDFNQEYPSNIVIHSSHKMEIIPIDDIVYFKAELSYTSIHLRNGKSILCSQNNIKHYEELLCSNGFFRIHKSYLLKLSEVSRVEKSNGLEVILMNNERLPLAIRRKSIFYKLLG